MVELSTINTDQIGNTTINALRGAGFWLSIILVVGMIVAIIFFIRYLLSFNILCIVEEKMRDGITRVTTKKAKIIYDNKKDGKNLVQRLVIYGHKKQIMFPVFVKDEEGNMVEQAQLDKKGRPLPTLHVSQDADFKLFGVTAKGKSALRMLKEGDEYTAVSWHNSEVEKYLRVSNPIRQQWANNLFREGMELFAPDKGFWDKYGSFIMMGGTFVIIAIIFIFLFNKLEVMQDYAGALNNYADAIREMAKAVRDTGVQSVS